MKQEITVTGRVVEPLTLVSAAEALQGAIASLRRVSARRAYTDPIQADFSAMEARVLAAMPCPATSRPCPHAHGLHARRTVPPAARQPA